jgi:ABC-type multidrug transport system ATPase subunit
LLQADFGQLDIMGQDISSSETRRKIGFALDPDGLYNSMTAIENLEAIRSTPTANKDEDLMTLYYLGRAYQEKEICQGPAPFSEGSKGET